MKVLMLGWEFPPFNAGGLGTACFGLTKAMKDMDVDVTFVLPRMKGGADTGSTHVKLITANNVFLNNKSFKMKAVNSLLGEYVNSETYEERLKKFKILEMKNDNCPGGSLYGKDLYEEIHRYAEKVKIIASVEEHDVIHAHDWMTYPAAIKAKKETGKPLVVHIHATEFDRTCGNPNQKVYDIEREGFHVSDKIVAVSNFTKQKVVEHYGVSPDKVEVVHNGVDFDDSSKQESGSKNGKTVLYLGRLTMQKGPEYFLYSAKRVVEYDPNVTFVMAGGGDMEEWLIEKSAEMGLGKNVLFAGFLRGKDIDKAYRMADLYVMPSVSEPFGITPLEAMRNKTPCIISKTSGVSEVLKHAFKVDFWDIDKMSNMIITGLNYKTMYNMISENASNEVFQHNWSSAAEKCLSVYRNVLES